MSLIDFCVGDTRFWETVGNGRKALEVGNAGVCLDVSLTFWAGGPPCAEYDRGEDTAGRDIVNVTVVAGWTSELKECEEKQRDKLIGN